MEKLEKEISDLKGQIELLIEAVKILSTTTARMDTHIDFVEQTYTTLKSPLDFITSSFWGNGEDLPAPPNLIEN